MHLKNYFLVTILLSFLLGPCLLARVHNFETARLKATAGTGVGSILLDEALLLNPAPLAFFNDATVYLQKNSIISQNEGPRISDKIPDGAVRTSAHGVILADAKGSVKGGLSYQNQTERSDKRERFSAAIGVPVAEQSAIGLLLRKTNDRNFHNSAYKKENYTQLVLGAIHAVTENLTLGVIIEDPARAFPEDNRFTVGGQYLISNIFAIMVDAGSDYNDDLGKKFFYRGALQINFFSDLYLRAGLFHDRGRMENGTGVGIAWVGPKIVMDFGMKFTKLSYGEQELIYNSYPPNRLKELAFSLAFHF